MIIGDRLTEAGVVMLKLLIKHEGKNSDEIAKLSGQKPLNIRAWMRHFELLSWGVLKRQKGLFWIVISDRIKAIAIEEFSRENNGNV